MLKSIWSYNDRFSRPSILQDWYVPVSAFTSLDDAIEDARMVHGEVVVDDITGQYFSMVPDYVSDEDQARNRAFYMAIKQSGMAA